MNANQNFLLQRMLEVLTDDEKRAVVASLSRSLNGVGKTARPESAKAKHELIAFLDELQYIPLENSNDAATARGHGRILYAPEDR